MRKIWIYYTNWFNRQMRAWEKWPLHGISLHYDTGVIFNSSGLKAPWTISWTVRLRRQTSDSSSIGAARERISAPDAASVNACKNLEHSTSVSAVDGINWTPSLAHFNACTPNARVRASSAYVTCQRNIHENLETNVVHQSPSFISSLKNLMKNRQVPFLIVN